MIFITCALHCEAKPIIEKYQLVLDRDARFPLFNKNEITLIVTGIGKILMATAMSYAFARYHEPENSAWLNVGIAGKKESILGDCFNINKITEQVSKLNWYPVRMPELSDLKVCSLITSDQPEKNYSALSAHDMEASAFMMTAIRFTTIERVQVVKIISDTNENCIDDIEKKLVTQWVSTNITTISKTVAELLRASSTGNDELDESKDIQYCLNKWHFSAYQKKSLSRLLQQWRTLNKCAELHLFSELKNGKQVILALEEEISNTEITFEDKND